MGTIQLFDTICYIYIYIYVVFFVCLKVKALHPTLKEIDKINDIEFILRCKAVC